jgi:hypothetical protein
VSPKVRIINIVKKEEREFALLMILFVCVFVWGFMKGDRSEQREREREAWPHMSFEGLQ